MTLPRTRKMPVCWRPKVLSIAATLLVAAPLVRAGTTIDLYPNLSPTEVLLADGGFRSPSFGAYASNVLGAIQNGSANAGGSQLLNPAAFNTIGAPVVNGSGSIGVGWYDIAAFGFPTWRGTLPTSGPFAGEFGTHTRIAVDITSDTAFTTNDVTLDYAETGFSQTLVLGSFATLGSERLVGTWWGADGVRGTADDVHYDVAHPGTSDTLVNEIAYLGFGSAFYTPTIAYMVSQDPNASTDPQFYLNDYLYGPDGVLTAYPDGFSVSATYSLRDTSSTVTIAAVPEPETWALLACGIVALSWRRRRVGRHV
jgi:hypothetical protein